jgi:hypothetical protein
MLGTKRLDEIFPLDLERYRKQRKQTGRTDVTINRELAFLKQSLHDGYQVGQGHKEPC